jgi:predicted TIM-barrel fold metal-dependent hydrolase
MRDGYLVIDADGHVHEDVDGGQKLRSFMDPEYRSRPLSIGPGGGGFVERHQGGKLGKRHGNPKVQIEDMDTEGVDVAVLYPTLLLGGWAIRDRGFDVAVHRAYNDWLADFCSYSPNRLKGAAVMPMLDPDAAARELEHAVQTGHVGAMCHPSIYGRKIDDPAYDVLWAAAQQYDFPISFHASGSEITRLERFDSFLAEHTIGHTFEQIASAINIIYAGVLERFPRLRIAFLEGMVGWVPMMAERMDAEYARRPFEAPELRQKPSDYFKSGRVFFGAESEEGTIPATIQYLGSDETLLYSSDYPHWDGDFPNTTREMVERTDLTDQNKRNILGENARRFYTALAQVPVPA